MREWNDEFLEMKKIGEKKSYKKEETSFYSYVFSFDELVTSDTLYFIDFHVIEKDVPLVHKLRISIDIESFASGMYFTFYNPFLKNSLTRVSFTPNEVDIQSFLYPLLQQHREEITKMGFPFNSFISFVELL